MTACMLKNRSTNKELVYFNNSFTDISRIVAQMSSLYIHYDHSQLQCTFLIHNQVHQLTIRVDWIHNPLKKAKENTQNFFKQIIYSIISRLIEAKSNNF
ncbi:hypothetical protein BpHYR1_009095 [Brachionus plicatilis]|uniref:Uncharacterized protein n=1 Tax=Brachionus plicatilis TaxID=10195 RepID=A0A3M7QME1_BRAPC|nr:hypothetical protein BpHYR1_009095 [Brachionus plicatilis]